MKTALLNRKTISYSKGKIFSENSKNFRKKHREKIEDLTHSYELRLAHLSNVERSRDQMQSELTQTQLQLDQNIAQLKQLEKMSRTQVKN